MLQQTTVAAVIPYYERFLERFPNVESLAAASEEAVLGLWEGLGYYSRGRNLQRAARVVMQRFGGIIPADVEALRSLPGIGRYTAGAIASFAFDLPAPIVEANTQRVYARLAAVEEDLQSSAGQKRLWEIAADLVPATGAGAVNQSLIDLGATLCTPVEPRCPECPLMTVCRAFQAGRQATIPRPRPRNAATEVHEFLLAIRDDSRWLVRQRPRGERWEGMWDFPRLMADDRDSAQSSRLSLDAVKGATGLATRVATSLAPFSHSVTRYRVHLTRVVLNWQGGAWNQSALHQWLTLQELQSFPMPIAARKTVQLLSGGDWDPEQPFELTAPRKGARRARRSGR